LAIYGHHCTEHSEKLIRGFLRIHSNFMTILNVFERFRHTVELFCFPQVGRVTVTTGLAKINAQEFSRSVVERADQALYYTKEHGCNRICNFHQLLEAGILKELPAKSDVELF
jgi:GGDEF domain-containing protein